MKKLTPHPTSVLMLSIDIALVLFAWWAAFWFRFNLDIPADFLDLAYSSSWCTVLAYVIALAGMGIYRQVWRYTGLPELRKLVMAGLGGALLTVAAVLMLRFANFPRSVLMLHPILVLMLLGAVRAGWRLLFEEKVSLLGAKPLLLVGSLQEVSEAVRVLKGSSQWYPVGIVSTVAAEKGRYLHQVPVMGTADEMNEVVRSSGASTALIASSLGSSQRRSLLLRAAEAGLTLLTMPGRDEWLKTSESGFRKIELEDLLGRESVQLDFRGLAQLFSGQTILVSGAGGSIGSELCRQIARLGVSRLVCVDSSEIAIYRLEQEMREAHPQMQGLYFTANVREKERLLAIAGQFKPSVVLHAAAYKHVPLMESNNEIEAIRTNILGTLNASRMAGSCGAQKFVLISTDKAVNPTNVMGATKRMAELVVQSVALEHSSTQYVSVRFGNVLGSSGSVVPLFTEQISRGGPVTVTHPDIVRYFMTIPEAARLVLQAGLVGESGQIYVLEMGEPVKIADLARMMIRLSGKSEQDIPIAFTGLRPGEKLFEELLADDETTEPTPHPKLRIAKTSGQQAVAIQAVVNWIESAGPAPSGAEVREWLRTHLPEYKPQA